MKGTDLQNGARFVEGRASCSRSAAASCACETCRGGLRQEGKRLDRVGLRQRYEAPAKANLNGARVRSLDDDASLVAWTQRDPSLEPVEEGSRFVAEVHERVVPYPHGDHRAGAGPLLDWFEGRVALRPGDERRVVVQAANSSAVEVRLRGRFVPLTEADAIEPLAFLAQAAPAGLARAGGGGAAGARSSSLNEPRAVLEVIALHGSSYPMRVSGREASGRLR